MSVFTLNSLELIRAEGTRVTYNRAGIFSGHFVVIWPTVYILLYKIQLILAATERNNVAKIAELFGEQFLLFKIYIFSSKE